VHVLIGDFNTEPTDPPATGRPGSRSSTLREVTIESTMATSRGGSLYDRATVTNPYLGGRELNILNLTGAANGPISGHNINSARITTRTRTRGKRKRSDDE
jgi:hypothetical protein